MKKDESREKFSAQQRQALPLLITQTNTQVAQTVGVAESTIYDWLRNEDFKNELDHLRQEAFSNAFEKIKSAASLAADKLIRFLSSEDDQIAFRAADKLLHAAFKIKELQETEARITTLEQALAASK